MQVPVYLVLCLPELWRLVRNFKDNYQQWMYGPLFAFDMEVGGVCVRTFTTQSIMGVPWQTAITADVHFWPCTGL
jgi:hypothetical protein